MGVDKSVGGAEAAAEHVVVTDFGGDSGDVGGREEVDLEAGGDLVGVVGAQVIDVRGPGGDQEVALRAIAGRVSHDFVEGGEEGDGVEGHPDVDRCRELRAHSAHAFSGGAFALVSFAFEDGDAAATGFGEVVGDGGPDDASTDDDAVGGSHASSGSAGR